MNRPLKLGIAGVGRVGRGLLQLLAVHGPRLARNVGRTIEVAGVSARSRSKARSVAIDAFIELIGGEGGVAKTAVEAALNAGKSVVTANKALLANHGTELAGHAER